MRQRLSLLATALLLFNLGTDAQGRQELTLRDGWEFSRNGKEWKTVTLPHDWAIGGTFDKKWDLQIVAIEQNGEKEATEKSGRSGSLPWIGEGVYRINYNAPKTFDRIRLSFDGAMSEPRVFVNGKEAGGWMYGYNAFDVDITSYLKKGKKNMIEVRLNNREESSRWYPGAGLYRPVKLIITNNTHIDEWSTFLRTTLIDKDRAVLSFNGRVEGTTTDTKAVMTIEISDQKDAVVAKADASAGELIDIKKTLSIDNPILWTPETPYLYNVRLTLKNEDNVIDTYAFKTGVRTVTTDSGYGFRLNGKSRKIQGVCLHHDLGPLGAAVNKAAIERQIRILKDMGVDAIRTAHNMPSSIQMEVCDSMGMMVMAESFDMWIYPKCKNGYAKFFEKWSDKDMENLVRKHRNHPSIIMWSIGNEIPEQGMKGGPEILTRLQDICHRFDETRPVTQGMDRIDYAIKNGFAQLNDVVGLNYRVHKYKPCFAQLPQGFILGSETASTVSSRGVYKFPVEVSNKKTYSDGQCSSYDTEYCSWSNLPEDDFEAMDDLAYTIGQFVWTGFDYLGEPTPYDTHWPSRSSYFGICDLAGLPKDRYYLYRSQWNKEEHTIHLLPHWTWPGREGKVTPVYCYTDYPTAELFVNGKSQGRISKDKKSKMDRYRLRWNNVVYEPGELKVIAYDAAGIKRGEQIIRTAGQATQIVLNADKTELKADGDDMAFVTVSLSDIDGNMLPTANNQMTFKVEGAGKYQASCNGDATSLEQFEQPTMKLFNGLLVVLIRTTQTAGAITLEVKDTVSGLTSSIKLNSK